MKRFDAFFLTMREEERFCILHRPADAQRARGAVLFVHPFAEEMNRCRRMAALQARAFADAGWTVLQMDLFGCGDSAGDFSAATWQAWLDDVVDASAWLREKSGQRLAIWGLRAGCLLAAQAVRRIEPAADLVLWQPVSSGKQFLQQFLRLKLAAQLMSKEAGERTGTRQLREQLSRGEAVEIAGYTVSPELALGLEGAELEPPAAPARTAWLEVSAAAGAELSPASRQRAERWTQAGHDVEHRLVEGPLFWQTLDITEAPALVDATLALTERW